MDDIESILRVYESRKSERKNWDRINDEIAYYVLPSQTGFLTTFIPGERTRWSLRYDSTAPQSNETLANHIHMALCSPAQKWFELQFVDQELNEIDAAKEWAQDCNKRMFDAFKSSNFHAQINTYFQGLCAFGTANLEANFMSTPANPFTLVFYNIHLATCCFDVDFNKQIDTVFHEYKLTSRQAKEKFGDKFKDSGNKEINILKVTRPNKHYVPDSINPKERKYLVEWTHKKEIFKSETAYEMPYMVTRYKGIMQDDIYGEGPSLMALSDIRSINTAKRLGLRGWEKAIDPPLMGSAGGIIGDLHIEAGGFTQVRDPRMIGELPGRMDINTDQFKGEEMRMAIRSAYKIDELLVPERKNQNPATATEIQVRYEQAQKALGATVGRIENELLKPLITRVFGMMMRNGQFAEMPEEISGADIDAKYVGPLAKSQVSVDAVAIERGLQASMGISQMTGKPSIVLDYDKVERVLYDRYSVPANVIRSEKEVKEIQQQQAEQQAQQQQQEQQMMAAETQQTQADANTADVQLMQQMQGAA